MLINAKCFFNNMHINVGGLQIRNPTILASGVLSASGAALKRVYFEGGAGAVVTKSLSVEAREGHKNPTVIEIEEGLLNAVGLANPGYKNFIEELKYLKESGVVVVASVFGKSISEYVEVACGVAKYADAVELNLSCPNVEGKLFAQSENLSYEAVRAVKSKLKIPVFAKLTPNVTDIVSVAKACEEAKADALVVTNTVKAMKIDIYAKKPVLANKTGGLSGRCLKPIAVRCVYEIAKEVDIDIIGCGGVFTGEDAVEYFLAGAKAVQIGTAVLYRGMDVFKKVCSEIEDYLRKEGFESIEEIIGLAL